MRVPSVCAAHVRRLALKEGWQFSDLLRSLIVLGATWTWGRLAEKGNSGRLMDLALLGAATSGLQAVLSRRPSRRPYAAPRSQSTEVVTLFLPHGYAEMVKMYAATKQESQNDVCVIFLERGLLAYLGAQAHMLLTVQAIRKELNRLPPKHSQA
jgi:hypothetical protein